MTLLRLAAPPWSDVAVDGDFDQLPSETTTARAARLRRAAFPDDTAASQLVIVFARHDQPLSAADREFGYALASEIEAIDGLPLVDEIWTEKTPVIGPLLGNPSGRAQRIVLRLTNDFMATDNMRVLEAVAEVVNQSQAKSPAGLKLGISGSAAIGGDMLTAAADSLRSTHVSTIALVTCALTLIYRSPWLVAIPLTAIAVAAIVSVDLLALAAEWSFAHPDASPAIRVFTTTKVFVVVLLFGAGTDYCLFLIARFRELLAEGLERKTAVAEALGRVGTALAASALTTVVGLAMMGAADFGKLAYSGPAIAISLLVGLCTCVTLAPALMSLQWSPTALLPEYSAGLRRRPLIGRQIWERLAHRVVRRPGVILAVSLAIATPIAWLGATTRVSYDVFSELPPTAISRRGTALLQRHFPLGEAGP
ncbi:MAG: MMPL family transporter, partial [Planctomycetota bacterium]